MAMANIMATLSIFIYGLLIVQVTVRKHGHNAYTDKCSHTFVKYTYWGNDTIKEVNMLNKILPKFKV